MTKTSQKDLVLAHLQSGKTITSLEALNQFGAFRLSSIIHRLKGENHDIRTEMIYDKITDKHFARYKLADENDEPAVRRLAFINERQIEL